MTNTDIYTVYESLAKLSHDKELKMPAKVGYTILKNRNLLEPYYKALMESRYSIIEKYAEKNDEGQLEVPSEKLGEANKELADLLEMEEEIQLTKLNVESLPDGIDLEILDNLMPILED